MERLDRRRLITTSSRRAGWGDCAIEGRDSVGRDLSVNIRPGGEAEPRCRDEAYGSGCYNPNRRSAINTSRIVAVSVNLKVAHELGSTKVSGNQSMARNPHVEVLPRDSRIPSRHVLVKSHLQCPEYIGLNRRQC